MNRRDFLKALAALPVGIAFTRFTEAGRHFAVELWSRGRLCMVRMLGVTEDYTTYDLTLSEAEVAAIEDWSDVSVRMVSSGEPVAVSYVEITTPPPKTWRVPPRSRHARKRDREWREGRWL